MAKPCTPHPIAQRVQLFKLQSGNVGGRGGLPSPFSGGFKGGILFGKRIPPLVPRRARRGFSNGSGQMLKQQQMQQQIMKMQEDMQKAQQEVEEKTFSASVGGGVVSAEVNGKKEVTAITIKPEAVDPEDVEMLQDLILSAVNEALRQAEDAMNGKMNALTSGLGLGGFGL